MRAPGKCKWCGVQLTVQNTYASRHSQTGRQGKCKACEREWGRMRNHSGPAEYSDDGRRLKRLWVIPREGIGHGSVPAPVDADRSQDRDCARYTTCLAEMLSSSDPKRRRQGHVCTPGCRRFVAVESHAESDLRSPSMEGA